MEENYDFAAAVRNSRERTGGNVQFDTFQDVEVANKITLSAKASLKIPIIDQQQSTIDDDFDYEPMSSLTPADGRKTAPCAGGTREEIKHEDEYSDSFEEDVAPITKISPKKFDSEMQETLKCYKTVLRDEEHGASPRTPMVNMLDREIQPVHQRIEELRRQCIDVMGSELFERTYEIMKRHEAKHTPIQQVNRAKVYRVTVLCRFKRNLVSSWSNPIWTSHFSY